MRTSNARTQFYEPSLVPLADMLTNTVGITLFILIFTVLTANGVVVGKRLPMERPTERKPLMVVCAAGRVFPRDEGLVDRFLDPLGQPGSSRWDIDRWIERFKLRKLEDNYFVVSGEVAEGYSNRTITLVCTPRLECGEHVARARQQDSNFHLLLDEHSPTEWFVFFLVRPDSLEAFLAARDLAVQFGYSVGWEPLGPADPVRLTLVGGGRSPGEQ